MTFVLRYPDSRKGDEEFDDRDAAIAAGLRAADERTVEVVDTSQTVPVSADPEADEVPVLLARYEKRDVPLYADEPADDEPRDGV